MSKQGSTTKKVVKTVNCDKKAQLEKMVQLYTKQKKNLQKKRVRLETKVSSKKYSTKDLRALNDIAGEWNTVKKQLSSCQELLKKLDSDAASVSANLASLMTDEPLFGDPMSAEAFDLGLDDELDKFFGVDPAQSSVSEGAGSSTDIIFPQGTAAAPAPTSVPMDIVDNSAQPPAPGEAGSSSDVIDPQGRVVVDLTDDKIEEKTTAVDDLAQFVIPEEPGASKGAVKNEDVNVGGVVDLTGDKVEEGNVVGTANATGSGTTEVTIAEETTVVATSVFMDNADASPQSLVPEGAGAPEEEIEKENAEVNSGKTEEGNVVSVVTTNGNDDSMDAPPLFNANVVDAATSILGII